MAKGSPVRTAPASMPAQEVRPASIEGQFADLSRQMDQLKAQVRQAQQLSSLGTAAAMIAHEVNNLLTPILSYAEYSLEKGEVELMKKALTVTARNSRMLVRMSERILAISSAATPRREACSIRRAVDGALESLCRDLSKDGIGVSVDVDESLNVQADTLQIQQVLFNLFLNAREAQSGSHSGRVSVSARREGDEVVVEVSNNGPAISADLLPYVFDALQTSKVAGPDGRRRCSGLGLALCRDLIEENGGTIGVTSDPSRGTTFRIALPAK